MLNTFTSGEVFLAKYGWLHHIGPTFWLIHTAPLWFTEKDVFLSFLFGKFTSYIRTLKWFTYHLCSVLLLCAARSDFSAQHFGSSYSFYCKDDLLLAKVLRVEFHRVMTTQFLLESAAILHPYYLPVRSRYQPRALPLPSCHDLLLPSLPHQPPPFSSSGICVLDSGFPLTDGPTHSRFHSLGEFLYPGLGWIVFLASY